MPSESYPERWIIIDRAHVNIEHAEDYIRKGPIKSQCLTTHTIQLFSLLNIVRVSFCAHCQVPALILALKMSKWLSWHLQPVSQAQPSRGWFSEDYNRKIWDWQNQQVSMALHIEAGLKSSDALESTNHFSWWAVRLTQGQGTHKS